jgi:hypothetical protein
VIPVQRKLVRAEEDEIGNPDNIKEPYVSLFEWKEI